MRTIDISDNYPQNASIALLNASEDLGIVMLFFCRGQRFAGAIDEKMRFLLIRSR